MRALLMPCYGSMHVCVCNQMDPFLKNSYLLYSMIIKTNWNLKCTQSFRCIPDMHWFSPRAPPALSKNKWQHPNKQKKKKKFPGLTALEMQLYHLTCFKGWYWARVLQQAEYQSFMIALLCVPGDGCEDFYWSSRQSWRIVLWHLVQAFTWFLIYQDKLCSLLSTDTCKQGRAGEEQTMVGSGDKILLKLHHFLSLFLEKAPRTWLEGNHGKDKPLSVSWR